MWMALSSKLSGRWPLAQGIPGTRICLQYNLGTPLYESKPELVLSSDSELTGFIKLIWIMDTLSVKTFSLSVLAEKCRHWNNIQGFHQAEHFSCSPATSLPGAGQEGTCNPTRNARLITTIVKQLRALQNPSSGNSVQICGFMLSLRVEIQYRKTSFRGVQIVHRPRIIWGSFNHRCWMSPFDHYTYR